ncbi:UDP-N-acetylmuramoyl-L-alanine--D-glutamate ligase [Microbulbifer yueqingensis]|uniref:UDP-N-acetylmuramoylalanine--D-glutamate ligase n=1 Tax=Microbulbifer yueqingensis TaxID=658219 RepID=A0A1G8VF14_9GAMM|nr:UDP-N-acetylmuramoyl-L-alanine--D-glutamate ligase [Microbulbifer yueqingensis]SDJ64497.1 UDP-N-acetylmuramoylalanine--D-glutamate ligase [Microbulbifer yueqingensis]
MTLIATSERKVVVGMGATGQSVVRYLLRNGSIPVVVDSRAQPPGLEDFRAAFPEVPVETGDLNSGTLLAASEIVASPGVALSEPALQQAAAAGIPIVGDIELFARELAALDRAPRVIAITGSNGKSTVTTLVGLMAEQAGIDVRVGGNIGVPVLDLLEPSAEQGQALPELFVLELSSFQLETTSSLAPEVATILNLSADHMDRYPDMAAYHRAKQRIYRNARQLVVNRADPLTRGPLSRDSREWSFGLDRPDLQQFGLLPDGSGNDDEHLWLAQGHQKLLPVSELAMVGSHNTANALAALALGHAAGLPMAAMLAVLGNFRGLPHRCERVADAGGVTFVNDSKGTNVGATRAALDGLASGSHKIVLIAGGDGKGADFSPLAESAGALRALVTIGVDGERIAEVFSGRVTTERAGDMDAAVRMARTHAQSGDYVLLSPACASFDMYRNFEMRGEDFRRTVHEQVGDAAGGAS